MGEAKRRTARGNNVPRANNSDTRIEFFGRGFLLELSRRAKRRDSWAIERLRIFAEATNQLEDRPEIMCGACSKPINTKLPEGFVLIHESHSTNECGFVPLCLKCLEQPPREIVKQVTDNLYVDFALTSATPIEPFDSWRRPQSIEEAVEQVRRIVNGEK